MKSSAKWARLGIPPRTRRHYLIRLLTKTGVVFQHPIPDILEKTNSELLRDFIEFMRERTAIAVSDPEKLKDARERMAFEFRDLGKAARERYEVRSIAEVMALARIAYRIIGADFRGTADGQATVNRCPLAVFCKDETGRLLCEMDSGFLAGLSDTAGLSFSQRGGDQPCLARIVSET